MEAWFPDRGAAATRRPAFVLAIRTSLAGPRTRFASLRAPASVDRAVAEW